MKIQRGDYPGASRFAYFDTEIKDLTPVQMASLLQCILHQAMPGEDNAEIVYKALAIAEQVWKERGL